MGKLLNYIYLIIHFNLNTEIIYMKPNDNKTKSPVTLCEKKNGQKFNWRSNKCAVDNDVDYVKKNEAILPNMHMSGDQGKRWNITHFI